MLRKALVRDWMSGPPITISPTDSLRTGQAVMKEFGIRHLPVVKHDQLVGLVTLSDIRDASPSNATTLSIWELNYQWEQLKVESVMTKAVVTVHPDTLVVDAVRMLMDLKISCLPVVDNDATLLAMFTAVDVFRLILTISEPQHE